MTDFDTLFERFGQTVRTTTYWSVRTARLMVGVPDYQTLDVDHRRTLHPDLPVMTYAEFFRERQDARYAIGKGRFRRLLLDRPPGRLTRPRCPRRHAGACRHPRRCL